MDGGTARFVSCYHLQVLSCLLNATLGHHIKKYEDCDPTFVPRLLDSFYVDDSISSSFSAEIP